MESLQVSDFKAFTDITIDCGVEKRNLLIYGDNGSGKSSVYEAIKVIFYYSRLLDQYIRPGRTPEQRAADEAEFKSGYKNKKNGRDFAVTINGSPFSGFDISKYQCFMISNQDLKATDNRIVLKQILESAFFPSFNVVEFIHDNYQNIKIMVNETLHNVFMIPEINIEFEGDDRIVKITDITHGLGASDGLSHEFNEAKINLISLLLLLCSAQLLKNTNVDMHRLLILDDVVSSLDSANRIFLTNYLLDNYDDFQKVILTHNVSYFNLMHFRLKKIDDALESKWKEYNIYETENSHSIYCYKLLRTSGQIKADLNDGHITPFEAGNEVRKCFEAVIYEYAKLLMVGTFEESGMVLNRLLSFQATYMKKEGGAIIYANDLVSRIDSITEDNAKTDNDKILEIKTTITSFRHGADVNKIAKTLKELKMFQKVVMHQSSHGTGAMPTMSTSEIFASLTLLDNLKTLIKNFKDDNAYGAV